MRQEQRSEAAIRRSRAVTNAAIRVALVITTALASLTAQSCGKPAPLTEQKANEIIRQWSFQSEPVYAEVPQRVWWNARSPKDDFDEKAVRTLLNLERAGLVTVKASESPDGSAEYIATVTKKGFPLLGTAPSFRGPVYRGQICQKKYDGLRNFERHPTEPTTGHAELIWHYEEPTWLYPLFETKINKPLNKPFASHISFFYEKHQWRFHVTVRKAEVQ